MNTFIASSVMISFVLLIILVLNFEEKSKIIKYSYLLFVVSLFIALFLVNEMVMDYLLSEIIRYLYFPRFSSIIATVVASMIIFVYYLFNDHFENNYRIFNYIFLCFILAAYAIFTFIGIDVNSYNSLYNGNSLLCLRYISRTFSIWLVINIIIRYFKYFLKKE